MYNPNEIAIYIHWPFCKSKCPYCDFYKEINPHINQEKVIEEYLKNLEYYHHLTADRAVKSIFFGGGTPSLIKPQLVEKTINFIGKKWSLSNNIEISLEANPNSDHQNMFADLKSAGINRLSLGVQALNDADLRFLGRTHTLEQAKNCIHEVVKTFSNHSADLIYARPQQKMPEWEKELDDICNYGLKHLSLYQLSIEENTVFARKEIVPLNDKDSSEMYSFTCDFLHNHGYKQYEISNFAAEGFESRHNLTYWEGGDYIGIGKSAHGRLFINNQHIATEYPLHHIVITNEEKAEELIIMGLRLNQGLNKTTFTKICGIPFTDFINNHKLEDLKAEGFLIENNNFVYASDKGRLVLDKLIEELCCH